MPSSATGIWAIVPVSQSSTLQKEG